MPIPKGKKRYYITLDQENMDRVKSLVAALNLPRQTVSLVFDEYLRSFLVPRLENILEKKQSGKQLSFGDLFLSVGDSNFVTDGEHRGEMVQFHVDSIEEDGTLAVSPRKVDEEDED